MHALFLFAISAKTLSVIACTILGCGTTVIVWMGTVVINYLKEMRDTQKQQFGENKEHRAITNDHGRRLDRIEVKVFP